MHKFRAVVFSVLILCLGVTYPSLVHSASKADLVGSWKEYWAVGQPTDVNYNDVYVIKLNKDGKLAINCPSRPYYDFQSIEFNGTTFKVRLINRVHPQSLFIIDYELTLDQTGKWLKGKARTSRGNPPIVNVEWEKLP